MEDYMQEKADLVSRLTTTLHEIKLQHTHKIAIMSDRLRTVEYDNAALRRRIAELESQLSESPSTDM